MTKVARTAEEMTFAAGLRPCPKCGTHNRNLLVRGSDPNWAAHGTCETCGTELAFPFPTAGNPLLAENPPEELGNGPSQILTPAELRDELVRLRPLIVAEPEQLQPPAWNASFDALRNAVIVANELLKLAPSTQLTAERDQWRALKQRYKADGDRIHHKLEQPHPSKGALDKAALIAHAEWLKNGKQGRGRLELEYLDLTGVVVGAQALIGARFVGCKLIRAGLKHANLDDAHVRECDATDANFESASMNETWIERGTYVRTHFTFADLTIVQIDSADLTEASFDRSFWKHTKVVSSKLPRVRLTNGRLEHCSFKDSDLRGSSFAAPEKLPEPVTEGTKFEGCDLRDTDWTGRILDGATFIRCKLAGAHGAPRSSARVIVQDCDVSQSAFVDQLR